MSLPDMKISEEFWMLSLKAFLRQDGFTVSDLPFQRFKIIFAVFV